MTARLHAPAKVLALLDIRPHNLIEIPLKRPQSTGIDAKWSAMSLRRARGAWHRRVNGGPFTNPASPSKMGGRVEFILSGARNFGNGKQCRS